MPSNLDKSDTRRTDSTGPNFSALVDALLIFGISVALLIPCFWQDHIQAGDLASHVYNTWLVTLIKSGVVHGLGITTQWTNVLFDWTLEALFTRIGPNLAERIVPGAAVLIFFWGAFSLINVTSGRKSWLFAPTLAMLSFGLVFELGFMNFYLSTGLVLWVFALLWEPTKIKPLIALPLVALALLAHAIPVAWAALILAYVHIARRLNPARRRLLFLGAVGVLALVRVMIMRSYLTSWWSFADMVTLKGFSGIFGVEQVWVYGVKYLIVAAGLFLVWAVLFLERVDKGGIGDDPLVQLWFLQVLAYVLMPTTVQFPFYHAVFSYIQPRLSLFSALLLCTVVGKARYGRGITRFSALLATIFFTFLYLDHRALNSVENEIGDLVETLPPGQRVVAALEDSNSRLHSLAHILDRRCVERCFSYGNYEPTSGQFRVRVLEPNRVEAPNVEVVDQIVNGRHIVTAEEAPLYCICPCEDKKSRFCIRPLAAGERTCAFSVPVTPEIWGSAP